MNSSVEYGDLTRLQGLTGVVLHPIQDPSPLDAATAQFLGSVGLPHGRFFSSRAGLVGDEREPYVLADLFALGNRYCPEESRAWHVLGYLPAALVVLDPSSGAVYIFQDSARDYQLAHRDVAALVHCLAEFRKLEDAYEAPEPDVEGLVDTFRAAVSAIDSTPLTDPDSEWNRMLEEVREEMW
ncbi:SUKH-4 family immunity protein [Streptomyces niveus]|uniref:SUKH-4 family immunity protein n=1 Tax=Streptomyces niveus TaxID=193462 RepID=UPI0036E93DA6